MKRILLLCLFVVSLTLLSLVGCKIRIIVPEGGVVRTESGVYNCWPGQTCYIDVVDFYFDETFIAEPKNGYRFEVWKKGYQRFCGKDGRNTKPCRVHTTGFEENPDLAEVILGFLESDEVFYLEPIFVSKCSGLVPGSNNEFTLRRGESTVREVQVPVDKKGYYLNTRIEGCPAGVCSTNYNGDKITFSTTPNTPIGTYNIQYIAYEGGRECYAFLWLFECTDKPIKIKQRWNFELKVDWCPI